VLNNVWITCRKRSTNDQFVFSRPLTVLAKQNPHLMGGKAAEISFQVTVPFPQAGVSIHLMDFGAGGIFEVEQEWEKGKVL